MSEEWREVVAELRGQDAFIGTNAAGGTIQMGALEGKPGISPMEMLLLGLAGCTGMDIVSILKKKHLHLQDLKIQVRALRAPEIPKIWTDIEVVYHLYGNDLDAGSVEQAIQLSEEKYCSVGLMLQKAAKITSSYHIYAVEEAAQPV